ncbi:hypothetical protein GGF42_009245 [Coemansia sp. RSA 2424]|nr:hypothetical protein GGF42_009245 [Coemansia sp. RSA 2424]
MDLGGMGGGFGDMASMFGGGMGGGGGGMADMAGMAGMMTPERMEQMYSNPMVQQMMAQLADHPEMLQTIFDSQLMLQNLQITPQMLDMLRNTELHHIAINPDTMRNMAQMQAAMQHMPSGLPQSPPPSNLPLDSFGTAAANPANPANAAAAAASQAPPEEQRQ